MREELRIFDEFMAGKGLRRTAQRSHILDVFLSMESHVSTEELHKAVRHKYPGIGYTTVYRTMRLLSGSGLCRQNDFGDGVVRFEHEYGHRHHDHLICTRCGRYIEVADQRIEEMQERMAKRHGFIPASHKMEIFGICKDCSGRAKRR